MTQPVKPTKTNLKKKAHDYFNQTIPNPTAAQVKEFENVSKLIDVAWKTLSKYPATVYEKAKGYIDFKIRK